jgi:hypothetical protein
LGAAVITIEVSIVFDASQNVLTIGIEMPFQRKLRV